MNARMKDWAALPLVVAVALAALFLTATYRGGHVHATGAAVAPTAKTLAFHDDMRKLWEDHVTWTRLVIVSVAADLPSTEATVQRLLQNQAEIGSAVGLFYGTEAGDKITSLLTDHIVIAAQILGAAKSGDTAGVGAATARWFANADDIAAFLSAANPENWTLEHTTSMMHEHLNVTLEEAVAHLTGDWDGSIVAYDRAHQQILEMADMLSTGIIGQFPDRFN